MSKEAYMSVSWGKRKTKLDKSTILYAIANRKYVEVHVNKDYVFKTSTSFALHVLIGSAFGDLFYNMDSKWLESYERAALYGETLEVLDYSPEIDTNLKVICFQTFVGHCGCILFNVDEMK